MGEEADLWDPVVSGSREKEEEIRAGGGGESTGPRPGPLPCGAGGECWARFQGDDLPFPFFLFFVFQKLFQTNFSNRILIK